MYECNFANTHVDMCICVNTYIHMYVYIHVHIYMPMFYMHIYIYRERETHSCVLKHVGLILEKGSSFFCWDLTAPFVH